jgi:ABC-type lipoprotein release transport system permease subunit
MLTLRLALRNAWRNPRRMGVIVSAVAVGVAGCMLSMALNYGMVVQMVETAIATELGHLQIHAEGFDADPELGVRLRDGGRAALRALDGLEGVEASSRRVIGHGLVSSARASVGVRLVGIEPEREARVSVLAESITQGGGLDGTPRRVLIGEALARRLQADVGSKLVISAQDLGGDLVGEGVRVAGLFRTASSELDRSTVYLDLRESQKLLGLDGAVSEVVAIADAREHVAPLRDALRARLPGVEVRSWREMRPVLVYLIDSFDSMAWWVYVAVFVAMAFGIANVLMMAVYERMREIGILLSVGMSRGRLVSMIVLEAAVVTLFGLVVGLGIALAAVALLQDGIDLSRFAEGLTAYGIGTRIVPVLRSSDFAVPTLVALLTAVLAAAWPAWRAASFRPAEAVRQT